MKKEVVIVTGFASQQENISSAIHNLISDGYFHIKIGMNGEHPHDISDITFKTINNLEKELIVVETNNDHVINALKVMRCKNEISKLEVIHYNDEGKHLIDVEEFDDGEIEWQEYPDGFLDEWPHLMGMLWSVANNDKGSNTNDKDSIQ